jgi:glycosyltransferase involved in cell wall biosynthesis
LGTTKLKAYNRGTEPEQLIGNVLIVTPGGLEQGGGIGRQMSYFLAAHSAGPGGIRYRVVDSRGPWFIGAAPLRSCGALIYLGYAMLALVLARCSSMPCVAHVNITGRGSTIRKLVLVTIARAIGLRYVLHLHDYDYAEYYRGRGTFLKGLIAIAFRRASRIVVLGRRDHEVVSRLFQLPEARIIVLHNAVPDPVPDLAKPRDPGKPCHLLFLGYLSARKGAPELLRALASLPLETRSWRVTFAGGGPIDEYRKLADDLGILDRLRFRGWLNEAGVRTLCAEADVLVLPSYAEGLAMAVLEGLSHGLAVITTPVGAHTEVIEPEVSGLFVAPGDMPELAHALARVIDDESLRKRLGRGARERFLAEFDVCCYASRLIQVHAGLLDYRRDEPEPIVGNKYYEAQGRSAR